MKFTKDGMSASQLVQKINMKCVEARQPKEYEFLQQEWDNRTVLALYKAIVVTPHEMGI